MKNSLMDRHDVDDTRTEPTVQATGKRKRRIREPPFEGDRHKPYGGFIPPTHESETAGLSGGRTHMDSVGHRIDASYERDGFMREPAVSLEGSG